MVDIIKFLPSIPSSFTSNTRRSSSQQITLPIFLSTINKTHQNDRTPIINNTKRWIGRCPGDPPRHLNISDAPYSIHRKVMYRELTRQCPTTTVDTSVSMKIKQPQQKNSIKLIIGTTVPLLPVISNVDAENVRLCDALSKHVTIKAEPLRLVNNFITNSTNTLTSWQKYWSSTHTQRRRKEATDSEANFNRQKREQPLISTTHFLTVRDSSFSTNSTNISLSSSRSCSSSRVPSSTIPDKQSSLIEEDEETYLSFPNIILSSREKTPPMNLFKLFDEMSMRTDRSTIKEDYTEVANQINTIATKTYKLPLPSNKPKVKETVSKRGSRSKSLEKKPGILPTAPEKNEITTSISKSRHRTPTNPTSSNKPTRSSTKKAASLSQLIKTTSRSKYQHTKWDEPYVGLRFDPPTPPCSPSLFVWPQDSDQDENDLSIEQHF